MGTYLRISMVEGWPSYLFIHHLLLSKPRYTLPHLQCFSGLQESDLLRLTQRSSWQCWPANYKREMLTVQSLEMQGVILPLCCLFVSPAHHYVQICHLKISIHHGHSLPGKTTQVFFSLISGFPLVWINLRRGAALTIKTSFAVNVSCDNSKMPERSS